MRNAKAPCVGLQCGAFFLLPTLRVFAALNSSIDHFGLSIWIFAYRAQEDEREVGASTDEPVHTLSGKRLRSIACIHF